MAQPYYVAITQCSQTMFNDMENVHGIINEKHTAELYAQNKLNWT